MGPFEVALARGSFTLIDKLIDEITTSILLEDALGGLISDNGESLLCMDLMRIEAFWREINQQKLKLHALDYLFTKLANNRNERVIMRILWGLDTLIEKSVFSPKEVAHALVCYDQLRTESSPFFQCAFKFLLKLIFFLDYKSNREVFNKSIEKSSQFSTDISKGQQQYLRMFEPTVELIHLLLSREMCLMPAYFAMHELIRSFPSGLGSVPHKYILADVTTFMDSFSRPTRLLYSKVHQAIKPICGITASNSPGFRLDSSSLTLVSVKGAMRYPEFLIKPQLSLICFVLGQLRCTELIAGMLDPSGGKSKTRSVGLESALVDWIVELMQLTEATNDRKWVRKMFEHLISVVITFMLSSTIRFNEIVVKLNAKLEGRTWTKSSHYIMWFVLNATSGFIGKNMLTDFVPCLRLFDILFPEAEDPDRAMELQTVNCGESCARFNGTKKSPAGGEANDAAPTDVAVPMDSVTIEDATDRTDCDEADDLTDTSADESNEDDALDILPPPRHPTPACRRNHTRLMHLTTAPVCLWQHVLRKSRTGHDHLPRVMPPALRPIETRISYRLRQLLEAVTNSNLTNCASIPPVSWKQLIIILNAYSTDNEASQLIQHLVDLFWCSDGAGTDEETPKSPWSKLLFKGTVSLPYGLIAQGRLQPLSNHLVRTMSVHLRMLILHLFLQKLSSSIFLNHPITPGVLETMCRILACREVEPSNVGRILGLLPKLKPSWSIPKNTEEEGGPTSPTGPSTCQLLSMLLDVLGHRLVDTFIPEVRTQTAVTLVALMRLWSLWLPGEGSQAITTVVSTDGPLQHQYPPEILLELYYMLEWTIVKSVRSLQAPDAVIYGLCPLISPSSHNQVSNMGGLFNPLFANTATGTSGVNRGIPLTNRQPLGGFSAPETSTSGASGEATTTTATTSTTTTTSSNPAVPYLFLMSEYAELNRFIVIALLQIYYAYDLEEVSSIKSFLVEQFRNLFDRPSPNNLSDLPPLVRNRLPDFLVNLLRQRSSPNVSGSISTYKIEGVDIKHNILQIPIVVAGEFEHLIKNETNWMELANTSTVYFCVLFRYLETQRSLPKAAIDCALRLPLSTVNLYLSTFCDYIVATLGSLQAESCEAAEDFLLVLRSYFLEWRVVPLDRFLMFLLTQSNYQAHHVTALNCLLEYIFVHWSQLTDAIACMTSHFPVSTNKSTTPSANSTHPDPLSSRHWPECVMRLHEIIVDQNIPIRPASGTDSQRGEERIYLKLPIFYGHMTLRLLPILETIFAHLLQSEVPLIQLIPLCRAVAPLFRFHRRPVNVCYVLLRNHWHFVPMDPEGYWNRETQSTNDAFRRWLIDHIRVQLIVHCVLSAHHTLALSTAVQKKQSADHSLAGLFTPAAWSDLHSTYQTCIQFYEKVIDDQPDADWMGQVSSEIELQSMVCNWYRSREKWLNANYVFTLLEPIRKSTAQHGLSGHPTAWRPWNLEENVSIQAAGLYAAAVELMSSFATHFELVNVLTDFIFSKSDATVANEYLNIIGSLTSILPIPYRLSLCRFAVTLINDPLLTDSTLDETWTPPNAIVSEQDLWGPNANRPERHAKFLYHPGLVTSPTELTQTLRPPRAAVHFFDDLLSSEHPGASDQDSQLLLARRMFSLKVSLWHAIWSHANTTQINSLPSLFSELVVPHVRNEAQLLISFHLVAPLMGALHAERPAKLIDLTAELYRAVRQVDSCLAAQGADQQVDSALDDGLYPANSGIPLVHVDTIADLLYHIKYMYVGNGVLDHVRPILPRLRPTLRKRLKFILPPSESLQVEQMKPPVNDPGVATYEGRVYKACVKPPVGFEDF